MKLSILASAVALTLGLSSQANAFSTIGFDIDGSGAGGTTKIDQFDWLPGNALAIGSLGNAGESTLPSSITNVYQAKLGSFVRDDNGNKITYSPIAGTEFTIEATLFEIQNGVGTSAANFTTIGGTIKMYYDSTSDSNDITGLGYGDGVVILEGNIVSGSGSFNDATRANNTELIPGTGITLCTIVPSTTGCTPVLLDQNGIDNQAGTLSHTGNGSSTINVEVTFQDNAFFKSTLTGLQIGLNDTTNLADPFAQANPSDQIMGIVPSYSMVGGQAINGADCAKDTQGNFTQRCDVHLQSDGSTSFSKVPEPATLALLGLGLFGLSAMRKRK